MLHLPKWTEPTLPPSRRIWRVTASWAWWLWLIVSMLGTIALSLWFVQRMRHVSPTQTPGTGPMSIFGWVALLLMFLVTAYTLRRRYMRGLPGQMQSWLWMHIGLGTVTGLATLLHANFDHVLSDFCFTPSCLLQGDAGPFSGYALLAVVVSGLFGRLLDKGLTRVITHEASTNGVGIAQAVEARLREVEALIERLAAGKSENFQEYCQALLAGFPKAQPLVLPTEREDFQHIGELGRKWKDLSASLHRQQRARALIRWWRVIHITLAVVAIVLVCLHVGLAISPALLHRLHLTR
jgi:hypothetical protein